MRIYRAADDRGESTLDGLDSRHTFSFGHYHDPQWMGFGALRVLNEDRLAPNAGFPPHAHANMEILSYVLSGALAHRDSTTAVAEPVEPPQARDERDTLVRPGDLQIMSAGHGLEHSESNAHDDRPVHLLQIWIQPDRVNAPPAYAHRTFDPLTRRGRWTVLASPDGADGSLAIRQKAFVRGALLGSGETLEFATRADRRYWLHVAQGAVIVAGRRMAAGDALGVENEVSALVVECVGDDFADILLFDLPS